MTILGLQYLSNRPLIVETDGTRHIIEVAQDVTDEWRIDRRTEPCDVEGTRITVDFSTGYYCSLSTVEPTIGAFVALNPHATWSIAIGETEWTFEAADDPTVEQFTLSQRATTGKALWFSYDDFKERLKADARADPSLTVDDVVSEFAKLTSPNKRSDVFDGIEDYRNQSVGTFLRERSENAIQTLYQHMVAETSTYSERGLDSTLGSVGNDLTQSLYNYLQFTGDYSNIETLATRLSDYSDDIETPSDITLYYSDGGIADPEETDKQIPFYFELEAVPKAEEQHSTTLEFGINQSVSYSEPNIDIQFTQNGQEHSGYSIKSVFTDATHHPYYIVTNLTCPNIDFEDKGKQQFDTEPFAEVVSGGSRVRSGRSGETYDHD